MTTKNPTRGFAPILAIILVVIIIGGGVYLYQNNWKKVEVPATAEITILLPKAGDVLKIGENHTIKLSSGIPASFRLDSGETISLINSHGEITGFISCYNTDPTVVSEHVWNVSNLLNFCGGGDEVLKKDAEFSAGTYKIKIASGQLDIESGWFDLR